MFQQRFNLGVGLVVVIFFRLFEDKIGISPSLSRRHQY